MAHALDRTSFPGDGAKMTSTILQPLTAENRFDSARSLRPIRVAILCDYREENWYSMDLVGDMLTDHLAREYENRVHAKQIVPRVELIHSGASESALAQRPPPGPPGTEGLVAVNLAGEGGKAAPAT